MSPLFGTNGIPESMAKLMKRSLIQGPSKSSQSSFKAQNNSSFTSLFNSSSSYPSDRSLLTSSTPAYETESHSNLLSRSVRQASSPAPSTGDTSIFSDLWSALTQTGKNPTCPGECVHAITSILCDHVLEEVSCGEPFLRCCVPNDSSYGTAVETSPPFDINGNNLTSSTQSPSSTSSYPTSSQSPTPQSVTIQAYNSSPPSLFYSSSSSPYPSDRPWFTSSLPVSVTESYPLFSLPTRQTSFPLSTTTPSTTTTERINSRCPGVCVQARFVRYCSNISLSGICDNHLEACCLQSEKDSNNLTTAFIPNRNSSLSQYPISSTIVKSPPLPSSISPLHTSVSTAPTSSTPSTVSTSAAALFDGSTSNSNLSNLSTTESITTTQGSTTSTESSLGSAAVNVSESVKNQDSPTSDENTCDGTCVSPLFSLLCDESDSSKVCANGGTCCINREVATTPSPIPECSGTCIPTFLSGVCTRPSELVLKTSNCMSGTICCHFQDDRPINERPPPLFNGLSPGPLRIPAHPPMNNYPHGPPPPGLSGPPNIQLFQRPNIPLNQGLRPPVGYPPPQSRPPPINFALFIPNRKPQIPSPAPSLSPPQPMPPPKQPMPGPIPPSAPSNPEDVDTSGFPSSSSVQPEPPVSETSPAEMEVIPLPESSPSQSSNPSSGFPGGVPFCPGPCIAPIFRFTCFGGNAIYPKFFCAKQGQICCAALNDIQTYEANIKANNGVWKPSIPSKTNSSSLDEASSSTSPTVILPPIKLPPRQATPYSCGVKGTQRRESPRIVGGSDALPGEWCWHVALINADNQYICGGALIGSQWILTAAHCITNLVRNGESIYVRVGDYDLSAQIKSKSAQTQRVSTTYIHHNHNGVTLDNDIALLKIETPVQINDSICLVCLPARGSNRKPGQRCTVTGYGYREEAGPIALKIREAEVPVVDDQECATKIQAVTEKTFILPTSSFCAGGEQGNDACQGDGGGPLVCEVDGFYELTGLVSWGFGCGRSNVPGVYVKVSNFIGWINQIISVNNQ
ncbi:protein masquerade isoform X2 [Tetranychus urticae]|nr:protein masquerade isoform X2 [Tetranychus urticae]